MSSRARRGGGLLLGLVLACGCGFVASEPGPSEPPGAWQPRDNGLASEADGRATGSDAGRFEPDGQSPSDAAGAPDGGLSPPDDSASGAPEGGISETGPPVVGDPDRTIADSGALEAGPSDASFDASGPPDAATPVGCIRGLSLCEGLEFVTCDGDGRWARQTCTAADPCRVATCDQRSGCGAAPRMDASCDSGTPCPDGEPCDPDAGLDAGI